jgi:hypothetical protein
LSAKRTLKKNKNPFSEATEVFSYEESRTFVETQIEAGGRLELDLKKHKLVSLTENRETIWELRLPLPFPAILPEETPVDYLPRIPLDLPPYTLVLIQAGAAALGYFEEGEVQYHKTIKKYMKRHKRGKSQINYLNTRGKSKAGSRIRLANTVRFLEEINERLTDWEEDLETERILYSCGAQLWGLLYQSKVPPPFEKKDPRLIKVPLDVKVPSFDELLRVNEVVMKGYLKEPQNRKM